MLVQLTFMFRSKMAQKFSQLAWRKFACCRSELRLDITLKCGQSFSEAQIWSTIPRQHHPNILQLHQDWRKQFKFESMDFIQIMVFLLILDGRQKRLEIKRFILEFCSRLLFYLNKTILSFTTAIHQVLYWSCVYSVPSRLDRDAHSSLTTSP